MGKRLNLVVLGAALLAVIAAGSCVSGAQASLSEQVTQLGLKIIEEAPAGIMPLEFKSLGELRSFLRRSERSATLLEDHSKSRDLTDWAMESTGIDIRSLHYSYICNPVWRTRFNLWADVYVAASGSFHWIDDVRDVRVGLSGFHPFIRLVNTYTDAYIYPNQQRTRIEGGGTLEYYLFIQGILTYYSEPAYMIVYYSI